MPVANEDAIDDALRHWRQGDITLDPGLEFVFLADLSHPHSPGSIHAVETDAGPLLDEAVPLLESVRGLAVLTQSCDVVRRCRDRPFVEVAPLVEVSADHVEDVRRLRRPRFAYCPATVRDGLVVDLDRTMTVEKAVVARWTRTPGCTTDEQVKDFALALGRKRWRAAFPDDFVGAAQRLQARIVGKHNRNTSEGAHLQALREIRVRAAPSWDHDPAHLTWWLIKDRDPEDIRVAWADHADDWAALFDQSGRFRTETFVVCTLDDMTARDYSESDVLDLDRLSA